MAKLPTNLITEFATLTDRMEQAIRDDERGKVLREINERQQAAAQRFLAAIFEDRNGEKTVGQRGKDRRGFRPNSSLGRVYRCLACRNHGINKKTLVRETGMTDKAVEVAIYKLRKQGYKIECNRIGYQRPKYRLAS
jgi:hypothetical protein